MTETNSQNKEIVMYTMGSCAFCAQLKEKLKLGEIIIRPTIVGRKRKRRAGCGRDDHQRQGKYKHRDDVLVTSHFTGPL